MISLKPLHSYFTFVQGMFQARYYVSIYIFEKSSFLILQVKRQIKDEIFQKYRQKRNCQVKTCLEQKQNMNVMVSISSGLYRVKRQIRDEIFQKYRYKHNFFMGCLQMGMVPQELRLTNNFKPIACISAEIKIFAFFI